jgi:hypothetical protein
MTLLCVCTYTYYGLAGLQTIACDGEDLSLLLGTKWLFMASIVLMWVATVHSDLSMVVKTRPFSRIEAGRAALWLAMLASLMVLLHGLAPGEWLDVTVPVNLTKVIAFSVGNLAMFLVAVQRGWWVRCCPREEEGVQTRDDAVSMAP